MAKKNKKPQEEDFVRVTMHTEDDGVVAYINAEGVVLAYKLPKTGTVAEIRTEPPFLAMSPCPYCGTENNRGHNPLHHTDPFLGERWVKDMGWVPATGATCTYFDVKKREKI